jgi:multidrug efflux pump subunit AcrA (membrane-fusion protein)
MRSRRAISWAVAAVVLCAVVGVVAAVRRTAPTAVAQDVPTGHVKRGDLDMKVYVTGELRASRSEMLLAPPIGGGSLQITHLLHTGAPVKKGELVMEFDPTEQLFKLDQNHQGQGRRGGRLGSGQGCAAQSPLRRPTRRTRCAEERTGQLHRCEEK